MTKDKFHEAYLVFQKIAKSNKKNLSVLTELEDLKTSGIKIRKKDENQNAVSPISDLNEKLNQKDENKEKPVSFDFFKYS